jgi:GntR family transcriptional repressor for pyruvate dehydrogenase complex
VATKLLWESLEPINYILMHQQVLERLHTLMSSGALKPGDPLPGERVLAELFQISRGTLREAFRILEHQGLIETRPGGRRRLRGLPPELVPGSPEEFLSSMRRAAAIDLLEARIALEDRAVVLACQRATAEELEVIGAAHVDSSDPDGSDLRGDRAFHLGIAAATHNFVFVSMMQLHVGMTRIRGTPLQSPERQLAATAEHQAIYEALVARDEERAREAMVFHLTQVMQILKAAPNR